MQNTAGAETLLEVREILRLGIVAQLRLLLGVEV
jgi:hypothetical protein